MSRAFDADMEDRPATGYCRRHRQRVLMDEGCPQCDDDAEDGLTCPNCGKPARMMHRVHEWVEMHGFTYGPGEHLSEEGWECSRCGAVCDEDELRAANPDDADD